MKRIVKDLNKLNNPVKPLEFITDAGIVKDEGESIISEIKQVLEKHKEIKALAAPQIGIDARIFCIRFNDAIKTFINPIVTKKSGSTLYVETIPNIPNVEYLVARPEEITTVYYTDDFKYEDNKLLGAAARIFDQQVQILDGILPGDIGLPFEKAGDGNSMEDLFIEIGEILSNDSATEEEKAMAKECYTKFAALYKEFNIKRAEEYKKVIEADPEAKQAYTKLAFTENVINGRAAVVENTAKLNREQRRALKFNKNRRGK